MPPDPSPRTARTNADLRPITLERNAAARKQAIDRIVSDILDGAQSQW